MMPGIRIRHASEASVTLVVPDINRKYPNPMLCQVCEVAHRYKTYHLDLDEHGCVIVSQGVLDRLLTIPDHGFTIENEVRNPPAQVVSDRRLQKIANRLAPTGTRARIEER